MIKLARTRRARRPGEWTERDAVTFIVTLATCRNVTLAARAAGMSRKAAYALRRRDAGFAWAWKEACKAGKARPLQGDKGNAGNNPPLRSPSGNCAATPQDYRWFYEQLAKWRGESRVPPLAAAAALS